MRAWAIVRANGNVIASSGKPTVDVSDGDPGAYGIRWGVSLPKTCATVANVDARSPAPTESVPLSGGTTQSVVAGYVSQVHTQTVTRSTKPRRVAATGLVTLNQAGQPTALAFDVAVIC